MFQEELKIVNEIWLGYDRTLAVKDVELSEAKEELRLTQEASKESWRRKKRSMPSSWMSL